MKFVLFLSLVALSFAADLTIRNNCKVPLWVDGRGGSGGIMLPGQSRSRVLVNPGQSIGYDIPANGLSATRFWAKYNCDGNGKNCELGDQMQYFPEGGCPPTGCTAPVDSLFEATWGCKPGTACHNSNPTTWWDTSQVDGYTIPYKVTLFGEKNKCDCSGNKCGLDFVDATHLSLGDCPSAENIQGFGNVDLRIHSRDGKNIIGCFSPCKKLNYDMHKNEGQSPTIFYCCPTPEPQNCQLSRGCISSQDCRRGPVEQAQYVKNIHRTAPGIYTYAYDDAVGLHACPAGTVTYEMQFCPPGSPTFPFPANGGGGGGSPPPPPPPPPAPAKPPVNNGGAGTCQTTCPPNLGCCGKACFDHNAFDCLGTTLCPRGMQSCNGACYAPNTFKCVNNQLQHV